jgi:hypothetical protein
MEVKATIVNMPESKMKTATYDDWYEKILESWGGTDYQLSRESLIEELKGLNVNSGHSCENGIVIPFIRMPEIDDSDIGGYGETYDTTPTEKAKLYIFDDGEVCYVHEGYKSGVNACYSGVYDIFDSEFDTSKVEEELDSKMGKKLDTEKLNPISKAIVEKRRKRLIEAVKKAIERGTYEETVKGFDPLTGTIESKAKK